MINPRATFAGAENGRLAAVSAINALYLIKRTNTSNHAGRNLAIDSSPPIALMSAVANKDRTTATLLGQNCAATQ